LDIATQISTNQPAYASDLMVTGQGAVVDIHEFGNKVVFTVSGLGAYRPHSTNLVASGTVESGVYRWGVPDAKFIPKWDLRTEPLDGTVAVSVAADSGEFRSVGSQLTEGSLESSFDGFENKVFEAEARLTMTRSAIDATSGPVVTRWLGRAYAAPLRSQIFSVPLLLHHKLNMPEIHGFNELQQHLAMPVKTVCAVFFGFVALAKTRHIGCHHAVTSR
jgi:hypothetical protein